MSGTENEHRKKSVKKLSKKHPHRLASLQYPQHLQPGDDVDEDVTAPKGQTPQVMHLNQSMLSLITAAGAKKDFHSQFDDDNSGSDTEREDSSLSTTDRTSTPGLGPKPQGDEPDALAKSTKAKGDGMKRSGSKLRLSLPKLRMTKKKEKQYMSHSLVLPPSGDGLVTSKVSATPRDAPVMSQMLEAQDQSSPLPLTPTTEQAVKELALSEGAADEQVKKTSSSLKARLKEIFGFETEEEVISEYPVWLLQSVLLQGYLYVTEKHISFYAYLPKKAATIAKSGYLAKRGKQNPKLTRYWFSLKGDVLSYYTDPSHLYFPSGYIDLRYGISAAIADHTKDKHKETHFTVSTHQRTYFFKGDSPASTREWVKTLQKVIFRSHNDGDSVKISLPIQNIIDIDESPVLDFAETVKIRVVESDETYAIDEYFFSFFSFGKDAIDVLRSLVEDTPAQKITTTAARQPSLGKNSPDVLSPTVPVLREHVRATLSPTLPSPGALSPRASGEWARPSFDGTRGKSIDARARASGDWSRRSMDISRELALDPRPPFEDRGRRSASTSRMDQTNNKKKSTSQSTKQQNSSDSNTQSLEPSSTSSAINVPSDASASQILSRSDLFRSPTINRLAESPDRFAPPRHSETIQTASSGEHIHVQPPSRSQTQPSLAPEETDEGPSLQTLVKGSYPLAKAAGFAGYLRKSSKRMSTLLASESMGYVEKVSGMWAGGRKHYGDGQSTENAEPDGEEMEDEEVSGHGDRFRAHFALPESEKLQAAYFGYLHRVLPLYGKIYIGDRHFCFRSLLPGTKTRLILPLADIENVHKERAFTPIRHAGLVVVIQAFEELFFEFSQTEVRDDCAITLLQSLESIKFLRDSGILSFEDKDNARLAKDEHQKLQQARLDGQNENESKTPLLISDSGHSGDTRPILFDDPKVSIINFKPTESLRITCLTIGSRGDVQPYIALAKGLLADGHKVKIATHVEFEPWIREHGIDFAPVDGDPAELMRICVENGMFTYSFLKEASSKFRGWIDELLLSAWKACQDTDLLIESPSAMAGIHIAEALEIPYFRAFTMPWTRTRAYPHAFVVPERKMGGAYNYVTYVMFDNVFWAAISGQVNRWRKKELHLGSTNLDKQHPNKVPFLYNFSPSVVIPPLDFSDWIRVTGYWFLDEATDWTPPDEMTSFIAKARKDGKKIVYIGFGSIVVSDPAALTKTVVESVIKADVRCILSKGWSDRLGNKDAPKTEVALPPEILQIKSAPHDWLFKQIDAAVHHGGAGTTGASLRAGLPTIIKPFFGDQFFFGGRVEDLGVGVCMKKLNVSVFSRALWEVTNSERMIVKARILGEQIRKENGVATAIQAIYRDLEYAKSLISGKRSKSGENEHDGGDEESWTFIGDEGDPELIRRIAEWDIPTRAPSEAGRLGSRSTSHIEEAAAAAAGGKKSKNHSPIGIGRRILSRSRSDRRESVVVAD